MGTTISYDSSIETKDILDASEEDVFVFPASFAQQRLWFLDQLTPGIPTYNIPAAARLTGKLNVTALEQSLNEIVQRHEALRTTFLVIDGQPVQVIATSLLLPLPVINLEGLPEQEREAEVQRWAAEEAYQPFDLAKGPLLRARLLRLCATEHVLLVTMHHIISYAGSSWIFLKKLTTLYAAFSVGLDSPLPELPIQYADYTLWQQEWLQGKTLEGQLEYWRQQLAGAPTALELPTDRARSALRTFRGALHRFILPPALMQGLKTLSQREGATLFMTLLAAFTAFL